MGFITWIVLGLLVGILAKWIMPGRDGGGFFSDHVAFGRGKEGAGLADQVVKALVVQGFAAGGRLRAPVGRAI